MRLSLLSVALMIVGLIMVQSCATGKNAPERKTAAETKTPPVVLGTHYTALVFGPGKAGLDEFDKSHLNDLAQRALQDGREIEDIKILAWGDKEYPPKGKKAEDKDVELARERARIIRKYLEEELHTQENISSFNMAKKPNAMARLFKNDDWAVKEAFEKSGITSSRMPDGSVSYTKASKALVIIDYEENNKE